MAEEEKNKKAETKKEDTEKKQSSKGGFLKYIIFGVVGLVLVLGIAFGTAFMLKDKPSSTDEHADNTETSEVSAESDKKDAAKENHHNDDGNTHSSENDKDDINEEFTTDELDNSVIDKIMDNLAFLDYEPEKSEIEELETGMSVEDSLKEVSWIEKQKKELTEKEKDLKAKQKDLEKREKIVEQKILKIEQVESARINQLAKLYDGMDSRSVAKLMANLDDKTVVLLLPRMKTKNASAVLQMLPSKRAARLS
ncbi:MAG: MotE family protein, partial [Candidatus Zixiibacteriota bacterium]